MQKEFLTQPGPQANAGPSMFPQKKKQLDLYQYLLQKYHNPEQQNKQIEATKKRDTYSMIGEGIEKILKGGFAGGVAGDAEGTEHWQRARENNRQAAKERRESQSTRLAAAKEMGEYGRAKDRRDPNSEISRRYQAIVGKVYPKSAGVIGAASADDIEKAAPWVLKAEQIDAGKDSVLDKQMKELKIRQMQNENPEGMNDPNSPISSQYQMLASRMFPDKDWSKLPAGRIKEALKLQSGGGGLGDMIRIMGLNLQKDKFDYDQQRDASRDNFDRQKFGYTQDRDNRNFEFRSKQYDDDLAEKASAPSIGEKEIDKKFAQRYVEYNSPQGKPVVDKNLELLRKTKQKLEILAAKEKGDNFSWNRIEGRLPDIVRHEDSIVLREDAHAAAMGALKATLGSAFTEGEGKRIMDKAYNETLSPQANLDKINSAIKELEEGQKLMERNSEIFRKWGTLSPPDQAGESQGFKGPVDLGDRPAPGQPNDDPKPKTYDAPPPGYTLMINPKTGEVKAVPDAKVQGMIQKGAEIVE